MTEDRIWFQPKCGYTVPRHRRECGGLPLPKESLSDRVLVRVCRKPSRQQRCAPFCSRSYRISPNSTIIRNRKGIHNRGAARRSLRLCSRRSPQPNCPRAPLAPRLRRTRVVVPVKRRTCLISVKNGEYFAFFVWKCLPRVLITLKTMLHA